MKIKSFIIVAVLAVAILGFGFAANAQTTNVQVLIAQLQAQIASLMAQLQALQAQQNGTQWCHTFNANLGYANSGSAEVGQLHTALDKEGISYSPDTGSAYGEGTMSAVSTFQEKYSSEVLTKYGLTRGTGYAGVSTRAKLNSLYGCGTNPTPTCTCTQWGDWGACNNGQQLKSCLVATNGCDPKSTIPSQTQSCTVSQPSITVISPNGSKFGGEQWALGTTQNITWTSSGVSNVTIAIVDNDATYPSVIATVPAYSGSYSWTVGSTSTKFTEPVGSHYKVKIYDTNNPTTVYDYSDNFFSITAASGQTSITVGLPPMSACVWGGQCNITWTSSGMSGVQTSGKVLVSLIKKSANYYNTLNTNQDVLLNAGAYSFTVPTTVPAGGQYQIRVCALDSVGSAYQMPCGESDYLGIWSQAQ